jgi:alkaline phosphatase D
MPTQTADDVNDPIILSPTPPEPLEQERQRPSRILFGSCNSQHYPQVLWPNIRSRNATAFVWAGDAIYADKTQLEVDAPKFFYSKRKGAPGTPAVMKQLYKEQLAHKEYSQFIKEVNIFGTFDDHDYGIDNGDETFPFKREAAIAYVETFLQLPEDSIMARRARGGSGVYGVRIFDFSRPKGQELLSDDEAGIDPEVAQKESPAYSNRSVAVFVLDVRSNKTPWNKRSIRKFFRDNDGDFLGEAQWEWFKEALSRSTASVNIVVNGLQVHADKYADPNVAESWSRFPASQERLYQLLLQQHVKTPILISGDVHHASLSRKDCSSGTKTRPLLEMTTSGMTHSWAVNFCAAPSRKCQSRYTLFATKSTMTIGHYINPWTEILVEEGAEGAKSGLQYALELNFGELEFDWENRAIQARVHGVDNAPPLLSVRWDMDYQDHSKNDNYWKCVNNRGPVNPIHRFGAQVISVGIILSFAGAPTLVAILAVALLARRFRSTRC